MTFLKLKLEEITRYNHSRFLLKFVLIILCLILSVSSTACFAGDKVSSETIESVNPASISSHNNTNLTDYFGTTEVDFLIPEEKSLSVIEATVMLKDKIAVIVSTQAPLQEISVRQVLYFYDFNGKLLDTRDIKTFLSPESKVISMTTNSDDNLIFLISKYSSLSDTQEPINTEVEKAAYSVVKTDSQVESIAESTNIELSAEVYPRRMAVDSQDNIYLLAEGALLVLSNRGVKLVDIKNDSLGSNLLAFEDKVYLDVIISDTNSTAHKLYRVIPNQKDLIETPIENLEGSLSSGHDGIYQVNASGVYRYNFEANSKDTILLWQDSDFEEADNCEMTAYVLSEDKIFLTVQKEEDMLSDSKASILLLAKQSHNPNAQKTIVSLGGINIKFDDKLKRIVSGFNKTSENYRIVIQDYASGDNSNNTVDAINAMNLQILTGDTPDLLYTSDNIQLNSYIAQNLLLDINTLFEGDQDFQKEDILDNIIKLSEREGKLYYLFQSFFIEGLSAAQSVVGDRSGWTIEEFMMIEQKLPDNTRMLVDYSQNELLLGSVLSSGDYFVNFGRGEANFNNENFYQLLKFVKEYGTEDERLNRDDYERADSNTLIKNRELALVDEILTSPESYIQKTILFNEPVSFLGYPSLLKAGPNCLPTPMLSVFARSQQKEGAWEFLKYFMSEEAYSVADDGVSSLIPTRKSQFEKQIATAVSGADNESHKMSSEDEQAYRTVIASLGQIPIYDMDLQSILLEEAASYFSGDKTAEEVAKIMQNRIQTLLDERKA